jgi:hypothetical protein
MLHVIWTLIFMLALALADGFCGGGFGWNRLTKDHGGPLRGRPGYYVALPLIGLGWLAGGAPGAGLALIWLVYRSAFGFPDNTITGRKLPATFLRHAVLIPALFVWGLPHGLAYAFTAAALTMLYAVAATYVAVEYGTYLDHLAIDPEQGWDFNPFGYRMDAYNWFETARGVCFAGLAATLLVTSGLTATS